MSSGSIAGKQKVNETSSSPSTKYHGSFLILTHSLISEYLFVLLVLGLKFPGLMNRTLIKHCF